MIRTIISIFISLAILITLSTVEICYVQKTFDAFNDILQTLYQKTEEGIATYEDGTAVKRYWEEKRRRLYVYLPHTALSEINYRLDETVGYLYAEDYKNALPQIEVLIGVSVSIPTSYELNFQNIF